MNFSLHLTKFFPLDKKSLFEYWVQPLLLEKWASPKNMYLKVPAMEARPEGQYRFEHRGVEGLFICNGRFEEYKQSEKLVQIDTVKNPEGFIIFKDLKCTTIFREVPGGTEVIIDQTNFTDLKAKEECEKGWIQSLDRLEKLFSPNVGKGNPDSEASSMEY